MKAHHFGSDFDDFLAQEWLLPEVETVAAKRMIAYRVTMLMREDRITPTSLMRQAGRAVADKPHKPAR